MENFNALRKGCYNCSYWRLDGINKRLPSL
jgi:hypothetical protein